MTDPQAAIVDEPEAPPIAPIEPAPAKPTLNITTSPEIDKIAPALVKVQTGMETVAPDAVNAHLGNKYPTLAAYTKEAQPRLAQNGIAIVGSAAVDVDTGKPIFLLRLLHKSGQWIQGGMPLVVFEQKGVNAAQAVGSGVTYARKYLFAAMLGMATEDDDGNAAVPPSENRSDESQPQRKSREAPAERGGGANRPGNEPQRGGNPDSPPKLNIRPFELTAFIPIEQWAEIAADWHTGKRITKAQQKRLYTAANQEGGWSGEQVKAVLIHHFGLSSSAEIPGDWESRNLFPYGKLIETLTTFSPEPEGGRDENENQDAGQQPLGVG